jgi:hypothetical protein
VSETPLEELAMRYAIIYPDPFQSFPTGTETQVRFELAHEASNIWDELLKRTTFAERFLLIDKARETLRLVGVVK